MSYFIIGVIVGALVGALALCLIVAYSGAHLINAWLKMFWNRF